MSEPGMVLVTPENVEEVGIHCVVDRKHPGRRAKIDWFRREYTRGLRIRLLLDGPAPQSIGFVEYAPGESAWRGVDAPGWFVVHCLWVKSAGKGYGNRLLTSVVEEARRDGRPGVVAVASAGTWCAGRGIYEKCGFRPVEERGGFRLLVRETGESALAPTFVAAPPSTSSGKLVLRYSGQCPFVARAALELAKEAREKKVDLRIEEIRTPAAARASPTPYGVTSLTHGGRVLADHAISRTRFRNILRAEALV